MVQGVKRMIDFISRPLLKSDSIYREIRAVNSEHQMNKNRDVRRKWQIFYSGLLMWSYFIDYVEMTLFDLHISWKNLEEKIENFWNSLQEIFLLTSEPNFIYLESYRSYLFRGQKVKNHPNNPTYVVVN